MQALKELEAFNVAICKETGAGRGVETTPFQVERYRRELYAQRGHALHLITNAEAEGHGGERKFYIAGIKTILLSTIEEYGPTDPELADEVGQ